MSKTMITTASKPDMLCVKGLKRDSIRRELRNRGMNPTGNLQEDVALLKVEFEQEYDEAMKQYEAKRREQADDFRAEEHRLRAEKQSIAESREERILVKGHPQLRLFLDLLKTNRTAVEVCFSGSAALGRAIARPLSQCTSLVALDLRNGTLEDNGCTAIARAVAEPGACLKRLDLDNNNIGPLGAKELGDMLGFSQSLVSLSVENNNLSADYQDYSGIRAMATGLTTNSTLTALNLNRTMLGVNGAGIVSGAFQGNASVTVLDLDFNGNVKQTDINAILSKIDENKARRTQCEELENEERTKQRNHKMLQALENANKRREKQAEKEAEERSRKRHEERIKKYEEEKEAQKKAQKKAYQKALERQAEFDEANNNSKKRGKKK